MLLSSSVGSDVTTATDNATMAFSATDMLPGVTFNCIIQQAVNGAATTSATMLPYLRTQSGAAPLGNWAPCTSPVVVMGLSYGDWTFQVTCTRGGG